MPRYQVTVRELVTVDRTYEVDAADLVDACHKGKERDGEQVAEDIQDTHSFVRVLYVYDMNGDLVESD